MWEQTKPPFKKLTVSKSFAKQELNSSSDSLAEDEETDLDFPACCQTRKIYQAAILNMERRKGKAIESASRLSYR